MNIFHAIVEWGIFVVFGLLFFFINDWLSGEGLIFSGQDERKRAIKYKSIVQSWLALIMLFTANYVQHHFVDRLFMNSRFSFDTPDYPLFYIVMALVTYFGFFIYNNIKMSAKNKNH